MHWIKGLIGTYTFVSVLFSKRTWPAVDLSGVNPDSSVLDRFQKLMANLNEQYMSKHPAWHTKQCNTAAVTAVLRVPHPFSVTDEQPPFLIKRNGARLPYNSGNRQQPMFCYTCIFEQLPVTYSPLNLATASLKRGWRMEFLLWEVCYTQLAVTSSEDSLCTAS